MHKQINPQLVKRLRKVAQGFGLAVFLVGLSALIGWQFDISLLKRILPSLPIIAANTALAFLLIGLVLFLASNERTRGNKAILKISKLVCAIVSLLGFFTLLEYIFGINFGMDALLFSGAQLAGAVRMSPQSAFNFCMIGVSILFFSEQKKKDIRIGQSIILVAGAVSLVSLFGFIYNITGFYTIAPYKGMAAHTAVTFVLIFLSTLMLYSEYGFMRVFVSRGLSGIAARRLFKTLLVVIAVEILATVGRRVGLFDYALELLVHLVIIAGAFVYLIFSAFRSLDELGKMEISLTKTKELDEAKTEFVGLASHQLRTPLTAVSWYTEMLLGKDVGKLNEKQENYLHEIYAGNRRMIDLVDDLLNSSRIDMGTLEVKPQLIDLREVIESALTEFLPQIKQKELVVEKKFSADLPLVMLDPELMGIVFQNLLSNAGKYTPQKGKIILEIKRKNSHIQVMVADTGWGIPEHQQKSIFTKLFRADNVRKRDTEGTGLGLYIAKAIVKKSGGEIWFESKEGKGTEFYITFKINKK